MSRRTNGGGIFFFEENDDDSLRFPAGTSSGRMLEEKALAKTFFL
jgi:hypothetical protein